MTSITLQRNAKQLQRGRAAGTRCADGASTSWPCCSSIESLPGPCTTSSSSAATVDIVWQNGQRDDDVLGNATAMAGYHRMCSNGSHVTHGDRHRAAF